MFLAFAQGASNGFAATIRAGDPASASAFAAVDPSSAFALVTVDCAVATASRTRNLAITIAGGALTAVATAAATGAGLALGHLHAVVFGGGSPFFKRFSIFIESGTDERAYLTFPHFRFIGGDLAAAPTGCAP